MGNVHTKEEVEQMSQKYKKSRSVTKLYGTPHTCPITVTVEHTVIETINRYTGEPVNYAYSDESIPDESRTTLRLEQQSGPSSAFKVSTVLDITNDLKLNAMDVNDNLICNNTTWKIPGLKAELLEQINDCIYGRRLDKFLHRITLAEAITLTNDDWIRKTIRYDEPDFYLNDTGNVVISINQEFWTLIDGSIPLTYLMTDKYSTDMQIMLEDLIGELVDNDRKVIIDGNLVKTSTDQTISLERNALYSGKLQLWVLDPP